jgi:hypothetical protein
VSELRVLLFGLVTIVLIATSEAVLPLSATRLDVLLHATSGAALFTALAWLFAQGLHAGPRWALAWLLLVWIPYVNVVLASIFARRYWTQGARAPTYLALAGVLGQIALLARLAASSTPNLV